MAFTAGSVELAKAQKLASQLSAHFQTVGEDNGSGFTAAVFIENAARKLGFGITGITTGKAFPPFGSAGRTLNKDFTVGALTAVLQNPSSITNPNGITVGSFSNGATVGIYMKGFVRDGSDTTVANSSSGAVAGTTFESFGGGTVVNGGFTACVFFGGAAGSTGTVS